MKKTTREGVVIIWETNLSGEAVVPVAMIRGNGKVEYFALTPMGMQDHEELWEADKVGN